jgi:CBS domain-containing protein
MGLIKTQNEITPEQIRHQQIDNYWAGDLNRRVYLFRRQRKAILESCRRIAVVGASTDPDSPSFIAVERLLGLSLEIIPVFPERESFLGLRCYRNLREIPDKIDIVEVFSTDTVDLVELARAAADRGVSTFWIEQGVRASPEIEDILSAGRVHLVQYESLEREYLKHVPFAAPAASARHRDRKAAKVKDRMSKNPVTVKPEEGLKDAIWKMEHGHFRHLPVVDDKGKLIGMLTDRDVRLTRPSLAVVNNEEANLQLCSISVQKAAVFDPVKVTPEMTLKEAAELMLRWQVGGLPVVDDNDQLLGIITYTDLLREFVGHEPRN